MNSLPWSWSIPMIGKGNTAVICSRASNTHFAALLRTDLFTVHPVAMSVTVRVKQCSPEALPPSWPTRSISTNLGARHPIAPRCGSGSATSAAPRLGMGPAPREQLRSLRGESAVDGRRAHPRQQHRLRVGEDDLLVPAQQHDTMVDKAGARILPAGARSTAQHFTRAGSRSSPYVAGRPMRGFTTFSRSAWRNAARAWSRCQPVSSTSSVRIRPLPTRSAPDTRAPSSSSQPALRHREFHRNRSNPTPAPSLAPEPLRGGNQLRQRIDLRGGFL